jgi:CBS domain containing-hemolysin-like protein
MDPDSFSLPLLSALVLLAANALFVTAEFALLSLRRSGVEFSPREGDRASTRVPRALDRIEELSLVAQVGSSTSSLVLGYLAAHVGRLLLGPGTLSASGAIAAGLGVAVLAHVLLAAQLPKLLGIQRALWIAQHVGAPVLLALALPLRPLTWILQHAMRGLGRLARLSLPGLHALAHTPEEIRRLVTQGHEQGIVKEDEREMIHGILEFRDTVAREVMTPRIDICAVPVDTSLAALMQLVVVEGHSRLPVYEGTIDTVVGVLLTKDLLPLLTDPARPADAPFDVRAVMREPFFVPDTKRVHEILAEFRQQSVHLAIVVDEFGGTYGLVTMEDLLEEIVGEINDEHDVAEPEFAPTPEGDVLIDGGASISEVNERFALALPEEDFDTIGGFIFGALGRVPVPGDEVNGLGPDQEAALLVEELEDRRITRVRLTRAAPERAAAVES